MLDEGELPGEVPGHDRPVPDLVGRRAVDRPRRALSGARPGRSRSGCSSSTASSPSSSRRSLRPRGSVSVNAKKIHHRGRSSSSLAGRWSAPTSTSSARRASRSRSRRSRSATSKSIVSASGKIQATTTVNISANTMGRVTRLAVEEGDRVKEGQFLLEIDPRSLRTQVERGEAGLLGAAHGRRPGQGRSSSRPRPQLKLAQDTLKRQQDLWKDQLTTKRGARPGRERRAAARAGRRGPRRRRSRCRRPAIRQNTADLDNARYNLSQVSIDSPIDGIVTRRNIELGENVMIGTMNNAGTVLLTIADMSVIEAELEVDETDIPNVEAGPDGEGHDRRDPGQDVHRRRSPRSATARSRPRRRPRLAGDELQGGRHHRRTRSPRCGPGFTCTADITTATRKDVVVDPDPGDDRARARLRREGQRREGARGRHEEAAAARRRGRGAPKLKPGQTKKETEGVFVIKDGKAVFVPVKTGIAGEKFFEVLSGVKDGDEVITGPFNSVRDLKDGDPVKLAGRRRRSRRRGPHLRRHRHRAAGHLGQQAALVHERARQHRRRDVDHRRGVAHPGPERDGHRRDRVGGRRRLVRGRPLRRDAERGGLREGPQQPARSRCRTPRPSGSSARSCGR